MQLAQQGIGYEEYMKTTGMEESKFMDEAKEPATRQVRMDLAMAAIIKEEKLEASDEEVEAEFQKMAELYGMELESVKKYLQADQVRDQIVSQKAIAVVVDSAVAEKAEKKTKKDEADAEEAEKKPAAKKSAKKQESAAEEEAPAKKPAARKSSAKKSADAEEKPAKKTTKKSEETAE